MHYGSIIKRVSLYLMLGLLLTTAACKKFLETKQYDRSNETAFYKSSSDFNQALIGAYATFGALYHSGTFYFLLTDIRSDNTSVYVPGGAGGPLSKSEYDDFTLTADNEHLIGYWNTAYSLIQKANDIINFLPGGEFDQEVKDQYMGEAKVLRAIAYYNIVRFWGGAPLVLERFENIDESYKKGRNSEEEIYTQVIQDLKDASTLLATDRNTGDDIGRADKSIALSLLGHVYLTRKNFGEAVAEFKKVIDMNAYTLLDDYNALFTSGQQGNSESIWQAQFISGVSGSGSSFPNYCAPINSEDVLIETGVAFGWDQPTEDIANAYEANDVRRTAIGDGFTKDAANYPYKFIKSYVDISAGTGDGNSGKDWYVIRYADLLLWYAEALNEVEGPDNAYASVDLVRDRAGLDPLPNGLSKDAFRDAVYQEERLESPFEGHRWFDLVRTGRALTVMNAKVKPLSDAACIGIAAPISENQLLLPIPTIVRATAPNIDQNPGY